MYIKPPKLRRTSRQLLTSSWRFSVSSKYSPFQLRVFPATKHASRSSVPSAPQTPMMKSYEYSVSDHASSTKTNVTYTYGSWPEQKALRVDPSSPQTEFYGEQTAKADDGAYGDRHQDDVEPALDKPLFKSLWDTTSEPSDAFFTMLEKVNRSLTGLGNTLLELDIFQACMANEVSCQAARYVSLRMHPCPSAPGRRFTNLQKEWKPETIICTCFRRYYLT